MMDRVVNKTDDIVALYRKHPFPVEKLNLFSASADIRERLHSRICGLPLAIAFAEGASLELSPLNVSKASGLVWLCGHLENSKQLINLGINFSAWFLGSRRFFKGSPDMSIHGHLVCDCLYKDFSVQIRRYPNIQLGFAQNAVLAEHFTRWMVLIS